MKAKLFFVLGALLMLNAWWISVPDFATHVIVADTTLVRDFITGMTFFMLGAICTG